MNSYLLRYRDLTVKFIMITIRSFPVERYILNFYTCTAKGRR